MNIRALKTLTVIREAGSFAVAADRLNMTLSAVSMQMKALEEGLGVQLFDRSTRPPRLTPMGRKVAGKAEQVTDAWRELEAVCTSNDELAGDFRVGFIPTACVRILPGFLKTADERAPRARFEVVSGLSSELEEMVAHGRLDAAVVTGTGDEARPDRQILFTEDIVFAVPSHHADADIDALINTLPFLQFNPNSGIGLLIAEHMRERFPALRETIVLDSVEAIRECLKAGIGFTALPEPDLDEASDLYQLKRGADAALRRTICLVFHREGFGGNRADLFVSLFGRNTLSA